MIRALIITAVVTAGVLGSPLLPAKNIWEPDEGGIGGTGHGDPDNRPDLIDRPDTPERIEQMDRIDPIDPPDRPDIGSPTNGEDLGVDPVTVDPPENPNPQP